VSVSPSEAVEKSGAKQYARRVGVQQMRPIDMVICGSVAVNRSGARIGKGAGYSDLEVALLIEAGLVAESTVIVAPVHALQGIDDQIPETLHDFSVDLIVTPNEVIRCSNPRRPTGVIWSDLSEDQILAFQCWHVGGPVGSDRGQARTHSSAHVHALPEKIASLPLASVSCLASTIELDPKSLS
jgi:hypothetical protein